jgi:N-acylneuraminate-9-phosphatase
MLKAAFLDLDHTLCDTDGIDEGVYAYTLDLAKAAAPQLDTPSLRAEYQGYIDRSPFSDDPAMPVGVWRTELWRRALATQGVDDAALAAHLHDSYYRYRKGVFCFRPGVPEMLCELRKSWTLIIITNGDASIQRPKLAGCRAEEYVDGIVVSGEQPVKKPHPDIFLTACKMANCEVHEAVHVGDNLGSDIQGGINAGLAATIWLPPPGAPADPQPRPDHIIQDILELPELLHQLQHSK